MWFTKTTWMHCTIIVKNIGRQIRYRHMCSSHYPRLQKCGGGSMEGNVCAWNEFLIFKKKKKKIHDRKHVLRKMLFKKSLGRLQDTSYPCYCASGFSHAFLQQFHAVHSSHFSAWHRKLVSRQKCEQVSQLLMVDSLFLPFSL